MQKNICVFVVAVGRDVLVGNNCFVQEEALKELQQLASNLPWTNPLEVWKQNRTLRKKKGFRKGGNGANAKRSTEAAADGGEENQTAPVVETQTTTADNLPDADSSQEASADSPPVANLTKFRVTCSRAGDKHSFSSNEAARDFGGAVQEFFQWKADMTKFDVEVGIFVWRGLTQSECFLNSNWNLRGFVEVTKPHLV